MTTGRDDLPADQWHVLVETAARAPAAVMAVSTAGTLRLLLETYRSGSYIAASRDAEHAIIRDVAADLSVPSHDGIDGPLATVRAELDFEPRVEPERTQAFLDRTLEVCRQAATILATIPADDADAYRGWVEALALATANAAKEGGFLGIGGERISEAEAGVLAQLTLALNSS